jgi:hypothetical protein
MTTKHEECLIAILEKYKEATTSEILDRTTEEEFLKFCTGCESGSDVMGAARLLEEKGLLKKELVKGGYRWSLVGV